jgi:5-methylcytosine-specific restriction enzyme A
MPRPAGYHFDQADPVRLPCGSRPCRWCKRPVRPPALNWCGDPICVFEWTRRTSWALTRQAVFDRDLGICALCGFDAVKAERHFHEVVRRALGAGTAAAWLAGQPRIQYVREAGGSHVRVFEPIAPSSRVIEELALYQNQPTSAYRPRRSLWDVDHIVPVSEGGDWFSMNNLRTLCPRDHAAVTAELQRRRMERERTARQFRKGR